MTRTTLNKPYTPEQYVKLPKWAQLYMHGLESDTKEAVRALDELKSGTKDSRIKAHRYLDPSDNQEGLYYGVPGDFPKVSMFLKNGNEIDVAFSDHSNCAAFRGNSVLVRGDNSLVFFPVASNMLEITTIDSIDTYTG